MINDIFKVEKEFSYVKKLNKNLRISLVDSGRNIIIN